jgi:hypothetical protein
MFAVNHESVSRLDCGGALRRNSPEANVRVLITCYLYKGEQVKPPPARGRFREVSFGALSW